MYYYNINLRNFLPLRPHGIIQKIIIAEPDAVLQFCLVSPAETFSLRHIQQLPGRTIRAARVPPDLALVADNPSHQFRQPPDRDLLARAGIHRLVTAVVVHQENAEVGKVVHIEELAQRRTVAPADNFSLSRDLRLMEAANEGRQHVAVLGVVVIVRAVQVRGYHRDEVCPVLAVEKLAVQSCGYSVVKLCLYLTSIMVELVDITPYRLILSVVLRQISID